MGRERLAEVQDFANPKGRMDGRELITDAQPRFHGTRGPGSDREEISPAELEAAKFCKELGRFLDKARTEHRYDELVLIAPPRFLGMMRKELGKEVEKMVRADLDRNLAWFDAREIERFLRSSGD